MTTKSAGRNVDWDINDTSLPKFSVCQNFEEWVDGHCRLVYSLHNEQAKKHGSGWAMRNTNNHNVQILKKSCLGVLVCSQRCMLDNGQQVHIRPAICDKARRKQQGKSCPNRNCNGKLQVLPCRGHCGYPVTHFWRHQGEFILFQSKGNHDHPRPEPKNSSEIKRMSTLKALRNSALLSNGYTKRFSKNKQSNSSQQPQSQNRKPPPPLMLSKVKSNSLITNGTSGSFVHPQTIDSKTNSIPEMYPATLDRQVTSNSISYTYNSSSHDVTFQPMTNHSFVSSEKPEINGYFSKPYTNSHIKYNEIDYSKNLPSPKGAIQPLATSSLVNSKNVYNHQNSLHNFSSSTISSIPSYTSPKSYLHISSSPSLAHLSSPSSLSTSNVINGQNTSVLHLSSSLSSSTCSSVDVQQTLIPSVQFPYPSLLPQSALPTVHLEEQVRHSSSNQTENDFHCFNSYPIDSFYNEDKKTSNEFYSHSSYNDFISTAHHSAPSQDYYKIRNDKRIDPIGTASTYANLENYSRFSNTDSKIGKYSHPDHHIDTENEILSKECNTQMYPHTNGNELFSNPSYLYPSSIPSSIPTYSLQQDYNIYTTNEELLNPQHNDEQFRTDIVDKQHLVYSSCSDLNSSSFPLPFEQSQAYTSSQTLDSAWTLEQMDVFHANDIFALESPLVKYDQNTTNSHSITNFPSQYDSIHHHTLSSLPPLNASNNVQTVVEQCPQLTCLGASDSNMSTGDDYVVTFLK